MSTQWMQTFTTKPNYYLSYPLPSHFNQRWLVDFMFTVFNTEVVWCDLCSKAWTGGGTHPQVIEHWWARHFLCSPEHCVKLIKLLIWKVVWDENNYLEKRIDINLGLAALVNIDSLLDILILFHFIMIYFFHTQYRCSFPIIWLV